MYKVTYIIYVYNIAFILLESLCECFEHCYKRLHDYYLLLLFEDEDLLLLITLNAFLII